MECPHGRDNRNGQVFTAPFRSLRRKPSIVLTIFGFTNYGPLVAESAEWTLLYLLHDEVGMGAFDHGQDPDNAAEYFAVFQHVAHADFQEVVKAAAQHVAFRICFTGFTAALKALRLASSVDLRLTVTNTISA